MRCPICKTELIVTGQERLQTLGEHVGDPDGVPSFKDTHQCPNKECEACKDGLVWDDYGSFYSYIREDIPYGKKYEFIDGNDGAFGSFQRESNVTNGKHDEDFVLLSLYKIKFKVQYLYEANQDGEILSRKAKIFTYYRQGYGWCQYISGIHMFFYCLSCFKRLLKRERNQYTIAELRGNFENSWDKRWWKRLFVWYINTFYKKVKLEISN